MRRLPHKRGKLLGSFFITYFTVLIVPIILAVLCYQESLRIVQQDIEYENQTLLTQAVDMLDTRIEELNNIGTQLVSSSQVKSLRNISTPFQYPNTTKLISARSTMSKYAAFNDFIFDYILYFNNGRFALNDQSVYSYSDFFKLYMHETDQDYTLWLTRRLNASPSYGACSALTAQYMRGNTEQPETINLVEFNYSFFPYDYMDGCASLYVRQDMMLELIPGADQPGDSVFIENAQGEIIAARLAEGANIGSLQAALSGMEGACSSAERTIDGASIFLTQITSEKSGFSIVIAMSADRVFARLTALRSIIFWTLLSALLLGGFLCYSISSRNTSFIRNIAQGGGDNLLGMTYGKALRSLQVSFSDIQMANEAMSKTLDEQKPYLQHTFLTRLIDGDFRSEDEAVVMAKTVGIFTAARERCVALFRFYPGDAPSDTLTLQFAANCKAVIRVATEALEPSSFTLDKSEEEFVLLMEGDDLRRRVDALISLVRSKLPDSINEMLFVYVGNTVEALTDVVRSYTNASTLIYLKASPKETPAIYYDATESTKYALFYPQDMQRHLIDCTMSGDEEGMLNLLSQLKQQNFADANMPGFMRQLFVGSLLNTLLQITTMSGLPSNETDLICDRIKDLMGLSLSVQVTQIDQLFLMLCHAVRQQKSGRQQSLIDSVTAYLDANYSDCELSLAHVAEKFDMSESYLSYTFKMQNGVNFFSYVEGVRIAKAKELLKQTNLKISDIAAQVGYTSSNSFCRAFKRSTGDNASTYRNGSET